MKVKIAVVLVSQGVFEVDVRELGNGEYSYTPMLYSPIDVNGTCISGSNVELTEQVKDSAAKAAEQSLATIVGVNWKPAEKNNGDTMMVGKTVN